MQKWWWIGGLLAVWFVMRWIRVRTTTRVTRDPATGATKVQLHFGVGRSSGAKPPSGPSSAADVMPEVDTRPGIHVTRSFHVQLGTPPASQRADAAPGTLLGGGEPELPPPPIG